jgi:hypothetical protein
MHFPIHEGFPLFDLDGLSPEAHTKEFPNPGQN